MGPRRLLCLMLVAQIMGARPAVAQETGEPRTGERQTGAAAPGGLAGLDEAGVRRALGDPTLAQSEGAGAFWTYRLPGCALFVYFADAGRGLRVTGVASGPRRHGEPAPITDECLAQAPGPTPPTAPR